MSKLMRLIQEKIRRFDGEIRPPDIQIKEEDTVFGTLKDQDLRKLFTILNIMSKEIERSSKEILTTMPSTPHKDKDRHLLRKIKRRNILVIDHIHIGSFFLMSLYHEIPEESRIRVAAAQGWSLWLCKDWQIVAARPVTPLPPPTDIARSVTIR